MKLPTLTRRERILLHVLVNATSGCWEWQGCIRADGYGAVAHEGQASLAHRVAYEAFVGPISEGLTLDHVCRNRGCANPAHLEPVTMKENVARGVGPTAINGRKTHCSHGHAFTPENTYARPDRPGARECLTCIRIRNGNRARAAA